MQHLARGAAQKSCAPPCIPTEPQQQHLDELDRRFITWRARLQLAEHEAPRTPAIIRTADRRASTSSSTSSVRVRLRMSPPVTPDELVDPAVFIGSDRLTSAYSATRDEPTRRKIIARLRYERHRWSRSIPVTAAQAARVDGWWLRDGRPGDATVSPHRAPGRPRTNTTAQAADLRARVEREAGQPWEGIALERRRGLVVRLAHKAETTTAAKLLGCHRSSVTRWRKEAAA